MATYFILKKFVFVITIFVIILVNINNWGFSKNIQSSHASTSLQKILLESQINTLVSAGDKNEFIDVIITLRPALSESSVSSNSEKLVRRAAAAKLEENFFTKHANVIHQINGSTIVLPIAFITIKRGNLQYLKSDSSISSVSVDGYFKPALSEGTNLIGSTYVNNSGYTGVGTSIALIDTGVLYTHPFLSGQIIDEACFSTIGSLSTCPNGVGTSFELGSGLPCPSDERFLTECFHGTHMAAVIAGKVYATDSGELVSGVAPGTKIISVKATSISYTDIPGGCIIMEEKPHCYVIHYSSLIKALDWVYVNRHRGAWQTLAAVNFSFVGPREFYQKPCPNTGSYAPINQYIVLFANAGIPVITPTGNEGNLSGIHFPACNLAAISVGASTSNSAKQFYGDIYNRIDEIALFSNSPSRSNFIWSPPVPPLLDLLAPGFMDFRFLRTPGTANVFFSHYGTSYSAAFVAGSWAILKGIQPNLNVSTARDILIRTGRPILDNRTTEAFYVPRVSLKPAVEALIASLPTATIVPSITFTPTVSVATTTLEVTPTQNILPTITTSLTPTTSRFTTKTRTRSATKTRTRSATKTRTRSATKSVQRTLTKSRTLTQTKIPTKSPTKSKTRSATKSIKLTSSPTAKRP
jgi:subtilisin family serine protease